VYVQNSGPSEYQTGIVDVSDSSRRDLIGTKLGIKSWIVWRPVAPIAFLWGL